MRFPVLHRTGSGTPVQEAQRAKRRGWQWRVCGMVLWLAAAGPMPCWCEWTTFNTTDGLAHNSVRGIVEDAHANLWLCTFQGRSEEHPQFGGKGVSRYDGVDFTTFSTANGLADANWEPPVARVLAHGASPIVSGLLTQWDTSRFTDGNYELRLSVRDSLALTGASQVVVMVDNAPPWAEETTPVLVSATAGGDVYTTGGNVRLYFGPHAFGRDAMVEITKLDAAQIPDTLANGAARLRPGYAIAWGGVPLVKPGTLEFACGEAAGLDAGATPVVYAASAPGGGWEALSTYAPGGSRCRSTRLGAMASSPSAKRLRPRHRSRRCR